jgi:predicted O-methyltransferase YrrM
MDITKRLQELDPTLILHNEGSWDKPLDSSAPGFTSFNDAGIETETGELLYSFTRILKPNRVLETGTHIGVGMAYMGQALKDNKKGRLDTIEFLPEIHARALQRRADLNLIDQVDPYIMDVKDFIIKAVEKNIRYQLILLDTEPQTRFTELIEIFPQLDEGGFVFIHDLHRHMHQIENADHGFAWPFGEIPLPMEELVKSGQLRPFHFPTPRGLTGFYKVSKDDYKWTK